jgi:hypothetical protein
MRINIVCIIATTLILMIVLVGILGDGVDGVVVVSLPPDSHLDMILAGEVRETLAWTWRRLWRRLDDVNAGMAAGLDLPSVATLTTR